MEKRREDETLKVTIPAHRPIKRLMLSHILKQVQLEVDTFLGFL